MYIDSLTYEQFMVLGDAELSRRFSMQDEVEQKEEVKKALAAGVPKATILTYFYPEVTVERMSSYRKKQYMLSHRHRKCGILCLCKKECVLQIGSYRR